MFTKQGTGTRPQPGDLLVIHGIGRFPDGKEFWNTRTEGTPYEYTPGVDRVIRGFEEGMRDVRAGDRLVITMKPELAYGERGSRDIPPMPRSSSTTRSWPSNRCPLRGSSETTSRQARSTLRSPAPADYPVSGSITSVRQASGRSPAARTAGKPGTAKRCSSSG